jgi:hypothetical protein
MSLGRERPLTIVLAAGVTGVTGVILLGLAFWSWCYSISASMRLWYGTLIPATLPNSVASWLSSSPRIPYAGLILASIGWLIAPALASGLKRRTQLQIDSDNVSYLYCWIASLFASLIAELALLGSIGRVASSATTQAIPAEVWAIAKSKVRQRC